MYRRSLPLCSQHLQRSTPVASPLLRHFRCPRAMPTRTEQNPTLQSDIPSRSTTSPTPSSEIAPEMPSISELNELVESGMLLPSSCGEGGSPPLDVELLACQLHSDPRRGLDTQQGDDMEQRARQFGSNCLPPSRQVTFLELIIDALKVRAHHRGGHPAARRRCRAHRRTSGLWQPLLCPALHPNPLRTPPPCTPGLTCALLLPPLFRT